MPPRRGWNYFVSGFYKDVAPTALGGRTTKQNRLTGKPKLKS